MDDRPASMSDGNSGAALPRLSVAIICKNNAATIGRTVDSVRGLAGEIVAIDSGSTDGTIEMLERAGAKVVRSEWLGHIKTKQKALDACGGAWVLSLDSDESPEPGLVALIRRAVESDGEGGRVGAYAVNRRTYYQGSPLRYVWQPEWRVRLVRRGAASWTGLDPHDVLRENAGVTVVKVGGGGDGEHLRHDSFETFTEHMRKQWGHATTMARSLHASGKRGSRVRLVVSPCGAFIKQLVLKRGFLDGRAGWLAAASTGVGALMKHAALLEISDAGSGRDGGGPR